MAYNMKVSGKFKYGNSFSQELGISAIILYYIYHNFVTAAVATVPATVVVGVVV